MRCEKCGYDMDALDRECRRCRMLSQRAEPDQVSESAEEQAPATEVVRPAAEAPPASTWGKPTVVGVALGASILSRSLYPSGWAYVVWVPAAVLGLWCGYGMVARARAIGEASGSANAAPQWRFAALLLVTLMLALNFPAANRHIEDPSVTVNLTKEGALLALGNTGWVAQARKVYQAAVPAPALNQSQYQEYMRKAAEARSLAEKYENLALDESREALALQEQQKAALAAPAERQAARERLRASDPMPKSGGEQEKEAEEATLQRQRDGQEAQARCLELQADIVEHLHKAEEYKALAKPAWDESAQNLNMARQMAQ